MPSTNLIEVVYCGPDADGVWTVDGTHFPYGEAVGVDAALAESLLNQNTFTKARERRQRTGTKNGQGTEAR